MYVIIAIVDVDVLLLVIKITVLLLIPMFRRQNVTGNICR